LKTFIFDQTSLMTLITATGALFGLALSIFLILRKVQPVYALLVGALVGGLVGGAAMHDTINFMFAGSKEMLPAVLRVLAAGILAGVLMESGASATIAETIIKTVGEKRVIWALALSTFILTASGVFIYVSVITVAPIALMLAMRTNTSKAGILVAMIGGGKCGNIISPNPNTIAAADTFHLELTSVMAAGLIPALAGIVVTVLVASWANKKGSPVVGNEINYQHTSLPAFLPAISGPVIAIGLLALKPLFNIKIDPMVALPVGGIAGALIMGKVREINKFASVGLEKTIGVAVLLLCTGCIAGIISNSTLKDIITQGLQTSGLPAFLLAPFSGIAMSAATASTTSGTAVACSVFGPTVLSLGVAPLAAAAMIHSGATVLDHLPHGSFFHASAGSVFMDLKDRLKLIPYETLIGLALTTFSTIIYGFLV
jgi:GntP family gluconate:H+ symporter